MKLEILSEKEYNNFIKKQNDSLFFNSIEWARFKENTGWSYDIVGMKDGNKIKAAAILLGKKVPFIKKTFYYSPRGYIIDYDNFELIKEFTILLKKYLKDKKAIFLKINPYVEYQKRDKDGNIISKENKKALIKKLKKNNYRHYGFYQKFEEKRDLEPRWVSVLELESKSLDQILVDMRSTTRWLVNKSQKNYITIREADYNDLEQFKMIMDHTAERRNFENRPLFYYQEMYKALNKNDMYKLLFANIDLEALKNNYNKEIEHLDIRINNVKNNPKKKNQILEFESQKSSFQKYIKDIEQKIEKYGKKPLISAGLYLSYGDQVVYLLGASYKEFMNYGAQYLMQYEMIKYAMEKKYKKLNFYGIDGDFSKNGKHYGLFDFKRGFNAEVVELIGEFDLIGNKYYYYLYLSMFNIYKLLKKIKRVIKR